MLGISCILKKKVVEIINTQLGQGWGLNRRTQRKERRLYVFAESDLMRWVVSMWVWIHSFFLFRTP